jgi:DNA-binding SARP family transcriptional activator
MSGLALWAFGPPRCEHDGTPIVVDTRKAVALLIYLAVEPRPHSRDALAVLLWPEYDQVHARAALRRTLSTLVHAISGSYLRIARDTIAIADERDLWLDVAEFHRLLEECRTHGHAASEVCPACVRPLSAAIAVAKDEFLAGFSLRDSASFDDWQSAQRATLLRDLARALARLVRAYIANNAPADAIPYARQWLELDHLHEPAHCTLMQLYDWAGEHTAALSQYRECVRVLDRELGVAPLESTTRLYEAIKLRRTPVVPATISPPAFPSPAERRSARSLAVPLVGRGREWEEVLATYRASARCGHLLILEGEAGIGKTRLAEELAHSAQQAGSTALSVRCYEGEETLAYAPIAAMLRAAIGAGRKQQWLETLPAAWVNEAARLVPEVHLRRPDLPAAPRLEGPGARNRFFEGVRQVLLAACAAGAPPGLLICDDAQWADDASLDLLAYLARRLTDQALCLVLTWRTDHATAAGQMPHVLADGRRAGYAIHVRLERLLPPAVREWVEVVLGSVLGQSTSEIARRLHAESEGLPFFVAEYVRALADGTLDVADEAWTMPGGVQDLLRSRLRALGDASGQVLMAAAVLGRSFGFDAARAVSGRSEEETVAALEELGTQGLLGEVRREGQDGPAYDFTHEKLRALIYEQTSLARRRLLHRRAAHALAGGGRSAGTGQGSHANGALAGQIAHHHLEAGDIAAAADYAKLAGEHARSLYANAEALRHLELALMLGHPDRAGLHESIGDVQMLLGAYLAARTSYEAAAATCTVDAIARIEHKLGEVHARRGEWEAAQSHLDAALAALGEAEAPGERARIHADMSLIARQCGRTDEAEALAARALALATAAADGGALAQAHNLLGILASGKGNAETAVQHLEESLLLAEQLADPGLRAATRNNLALAQGRAGNLERAVNLAEEALAICVAQGDRHHEAALHNNIADLFHVADRDGDAMAHLKQAVTIYAEIGVEAGAVRPEIWKLTEW